MEERSARSADGVLNLPMVPLRDIVVFPSHHGSLRGGAEALAAGVERALAEDKRLFLPPSATPRWTTPSPTRSTTVGTVATIVQHLKLPNGNVKLLVEGEPRARAGDRGGPGRLLPRGPQAHRAQGGGQPRGPGDDEPDLHPLRALHQVLAGTSLRDDALHRPHRRPRPPGRHHRRPPAGGGGGEAGPAGDDLPIDRLESVAGCWRIEIEKLQVDKKIHTRVKKQMEKAQKEYYLNEKIKAIQKELGRKDDRGTRSRSSSRRSRRPRCPRRPRRRPSRS